MLFILGMLVNSIRCLSWAEFQFNPECASARMCFSSVNF